MKLLPLLLSLFVFISCQSWYKTSVDMTKITNKTTYQPFTELNDPIVVNMPVYETLYLWGNENNKFKQNRIGDMFVIYDWESDEVYDWVFYGKESFYSLPNIIHVGNKPKYYINSLDSSGTIAKLEADKTSVTLYKTDKRGTFFNYSTPGKYCFRDHAGYSKELEKVLFCLNIFDCEKGQYTDADIQVPTDAYGYISQPVADNEGNFYFANVLNGYSHIYRVDCSTETVEIKDININCFKSNTEEYEYTFDVRYVIDEENLFVYKGHLGLPPYYGNKLFLMSFTDNVRKEFTLDLDGYKWLYRIVCQDNNYYAIVEDCSDEQHLVYVYKLDINNMTVELINENNPITINFNQELFVRGTRIYFLNYLNRHKIQYSYFDVETKEVSEIKVLNQKEVVGFDF